MFFLQNTERNENMSTVSAISTPFGRGGIAVIRLTGEDAIKITSEIFKPASKKSLLDYGPNRLVYGDIYKDGRIIDRGMAVFFSAPHSYTGEDSAEIHCHGGILLSQMVLEATFAAGALPAGKGEFTKRAFLSGKMGLSQAEAVIDLIDAESEYKAVLSASQADGRLSRKVNGIYDRIMRIVSSIYAFIDYPDEDLTDVSVDDMKNELMEIKNELTELKKTYRTGKAVCEGIPTVIAGKPNTGKSSLLNMLLGEERAIVTAVAGTTRDTLEETLGAGKVLLRLCDTAGIHSSDDEVEKLGVERAVGKLRSAELILAVFDRSQELDGDDREFLRELEACKDKTIIVILNKTDKGCVLGKNDFCDITPYVAETSAKNEEGRNELIELIEKVYIEGNIDYDSVTMVTNARQFASVTSAVTHIESALNSLKEGFTQDIAGMELELALSTLGDLDGKKVTEDVVQNIFGRFCVGK